MNNYFDELFEQLPNGRWRERIKPSLVAMKHVADIHHLFADNRFRRTGSWHPTLGESLEGGKWQYGTGKVPDTRHFFFGNEYRIRDVVRGTIPAIF
jgi:hypothetical protein